ncbi:MAG: hypothetical protein C4346_16190 [Chloroflexota bacterium]
MCQWLRRLIACWVLLTVPAFVLTHTPPEPAQAQGDAAALVAQAARRMASVQSFHFVLTTPRGKTMITEQVELQSVEGDVARPDRFRAAFTAKAAFVTLTIKVIGIGDRLWVTNPMEREETYLEVANPAAEQLPQLDLLNPDRLMTAAVQLLEDPKIAGTEKIDGVPATRVEGTFNVKRIEEIAGTPIAELAGVQPLGVRIWIDQEGRVLRLELDGPLTKMETSPIVRRLDLSQFDEPVVIEPPASTPEASS